MARHTLSYAIARLRANHGLMVVSPNNAGDRAMFLMCFLRYVEDNAEALGIQFSDQERLESILPAYGTAFFTQAHLVSHVVTIATRLGMDGRAFRKYVESLSTGDVKENAPYFDLEFFTQAHLVSHVVTIATRLGMDGRAFRKYVESLSTGDVKENAPYFDLEPGTLKNAESNGTADLIDRIFFRDARHRLVTATMVGRLAKRLYESSACISSGVTIRIYDPFCFQGTMLIQTWNIFAKATQGIAFALGGSDADGICVATTSMRLFMSGYRGDYSDIRMDEGTQSTPTSGLYDIVVTTCSTNEYRTGRTILKVLSQVVENSLKSGGVGIFVTPVGMLQDRLDSEGREYLLEKHKLSSWKVLSQVVENSLKSGGVGIFVTPVGMLQDRLDSEGREYLLEKHKLSSCIELRFSDYSSTPYTDALWIMDQNDRTDAPNSSIFLASLGGDGLTKNNPDFYEDLNGTPEQCAESIEWFTEFVAEQKCLPFLSAKVPIKRILERRDVSLRFSTYESTIDMGSRVQLSVFLSVAMFRCGSQPTSRP